MPFLRSQAKKALQDLRRCIFSPMKVVEHSTDWETWKRWIGPGPDDEILKAWEKVQEFIEQEQPYGFFRCVDWTFIPEVPETTT